MANGKLAWMTGLRLPLVVLKGCEGRFYIGTTTELCAVSQESVEAWADAKLALDALESGDWTQRELS